MGIITNLLATVAAVPAEPEFSHFIAQFISWLNGVIGNYGWTVVVFTVILKLALSPLDIWQKSVMHKNNRAMERMKPQIAKLQKQYANNKEMFQQQQMKLYKKEGYSMLGACLPTIITLVLFFIVFAGFNSMATYMVQKNYYDLAVEYNSAYEATVEYDGEIVLNEEEATKAAESAVLELYKANEDNFRWLWVKNVFVSDNWNKPIPSYADFTSNGLSGLRVPTSWIGENTENYDKVTKVLREHEDYQGWNGYIILPLLTILITLGSQLLMKQPQAPGVDTDLATGKAPGSGMMKFMMPAMMGFFALFYSTAFTIYLLVSQLISLLTSLVFNFFADRRDKKEDEYILTHTYK